MLWHARPDASILPAMNTTTATASTTTTQKWTIDPTHTTVGFSVRHLMITNVHGEFQKVSGKVTYDPARPEATRHPEDANRSPSSVTMTRSGFARATSIAASQPGATKDREKSASSTRVTCAGAS